MSDVVTATISSIPIPADVGGTDWAAQRSAVARALDQFPSLQGYQFATEAGQPIGLQLDDVDRTGSLRISWPLREDQDAAQVERRVSVTYAGYRCAYPCLDGSGRPLHPLMAWWAVLFGLSILARYEPQAWGRVIDVNTSDEAVAVEHLLETSLDSLPELIYRSLAE